MKLFGKRIGIPTAVFETVYTMPAWQKAAIFLAAWLVPVAAFWFLFLASTQEELRSLTKQIPELQEEIRRLEAKAKTLPQLEAELKGLSDIFNKATRLLPESEDIPSILSQISSLGNEAHLQFSSFKPGSERKQDFYAAIPVNITITGPFHNTMAFFDKVAHMSRIVHITSVNMGGAKQSGEIWSQKGANAPAGGGAAVQQAQPSAQSGSGEGQGGKVERGGSWVVTTTCTAETYRFLTEDERKKSSKKKSKKRRKKRRRR